MDLVSRVTNKLEWRRQPKNSSKLTTSMPLISLESDPSSGVAHMMMSFLWHGTKSEPLLIMKRCHYHHDTIASIYVRKTSICASPSKTVSPTNQTLTTQSTGLSRTKRDSQSPNLLLHIKMSIARTSANRSSITGNLRCSKSQQQSCSWRSAALLQTKLLCWVWDASMAEASSGAASPTSLITS